MNLATGKKALDGEEHCRLQSIPDYVVVAGSLERQFKSVNNCVPVGMAYAIGKTLIEAAGMGDLVSTESLTMTTTATHLGSYMTFLTMRTF